MRLSKTQVFAILGSEADDCRSVLVKERAVHFRGTLRMNRELTYNPLVGKVVRMLEGGPRRLDQLTEEQFTPLSQEIIQQALYALLNAEYVSLITKENRSFLEIRALKVEELMSNSLDGERRKLSGSVSLLKQVWAENPQFCPDKAKLKSAVEFPTEKIDPMSPKNKKFIEALVTERPPSLRRLTVDGSGMKENRNEILEKSGLLNVKVKLVGFDVDQATFIDSFWLSHCLIFRGVRGSAGCVISTVRGARNSSFVASVQDLVDKSVAFRDQLISQSEPVNITGN